MKYLAQSLLLFAVIASADASASQHAATSVRREGSIDAMGSVTTIVAYGEDAKRLETAVSQALDEMRRLDELLSNYKPQSEWSQMNRVAPHGPFHASEELFQLVSRCVEYSRESEGAFDISVAPLMKIWGFYKGSGHLPEHSAVANVLPSVGYRNIVLDPQARTVRFLKEGVELDPGGVGKGYAVDRMADVLRKQSVRSAFISAGGSSIYAIGSPSGEAGWRVRLPNSGAQSGVPVTVDLRDESLSTSGSSEKFFYADGKRWSHIMDPRTGYPSEGVLSVSVVAPKTVDSEVWAKPYFILGRRWTAQHKEPGFQVFLCEDKPEQPCAWVQ